MTENNASKPIFLDLANESDDPCVTEIESYCFNCTKQVSLSKSKDCHYYNDLTSFIARKYNHSGNGSALMENHCQKMTYLGFEGS